MSFLIHYIFSSPELNPGMFFKLKYILSWKILLIYPSDKLFWNTHY